jgi:hypothetical protein
MTTAVTSVGPGIMIVIMLLNVAAFAYNLYKIIDWASRRNRIEDGGAGTGASSIRANIIVGALNLAVIILIFTSPY